MPLTRVTITGIDARTDLDEVGRISEQYPWVEWGILLGKNAASSLGVDEPRYPSLPTFRSLLAMLRADPRVRHLSVHFCGVIASEAARLKTGETNTWWDVLEGARARVQLNLGLPLEISHAALMSMNNHVIFQVRGGDMVDVAVALTRQSGVAPLFDASCGKGKPIDVDSAIATAKRWRNMVGDKETPVGFAGGISPENVEEILSKIDAAWPGLFWIDMESGVRSSSILVNAPPELRDYMDLDKVRKVLASCDRLARASAQRRAPGPGFKFNVDISEERIAEVARVDPSASAKLGDVLRETVERRARAAAQPPTETPSDPPPPAPAPFDWRAVPILPPDERAVHLCRSAQAAFDRSLLHLRKAHAKIEEQIQSMNEDLELAARDTLRAELSVDAIRLLLRLVDFPNATGRPVCHVDDPNHVPILAAVPRMLVDRLILAESELGLARRLFNGGLLCLAMGKGETFHLKLTLAGADLLQRRGVPGMLA